MLAKPGNPRSPSPPVRRSLSTDRGTLIRSRLKPETTEKRIAKLQYPASVNKSRSLSQASGNLLVDRHDNSHTKGDNIPDQENEQLKSVLTVRQSSVRKNKQETHKFKAKNQSATKTPKDDDFTSLTDIHAGGKIEEGRKSDFSEPENDIGVFSSPAFSINSRMKKLQSNSTRSYQYLESRYV